ncbi:uncharacterized protein EDB91DRAFT_1247079 [Suillus paluster]|uniref:uncharacterized protein n=1 Tax=Suillus paluster TaxID=48578 RepID=UPI001B87922C|nr:uncharacterized protein EDB91DRAFT_1247079 [Suillus paluster]KAG1743579.1 hypothetical protein EDB91DRAFT_1247079 [Suillus paluster]
MSTTTVHCPSCKRTFKTRSHFNAHIALAPNCKWVRTMCNPQNDIEMRDYCELSDQDDDHLGNQDGGDVDEAELGEIEDSQHKAGSPSRTSAGLPHRAMRNDCGDPILIVERHPEAGRVLRCDDATHATYMWTCHDLQSKDNQYHPFLDEGDYKVARWAIKQGPNQNALTDFLSIDEENSKIGLSYKNARALHQKIDHELPGVTPWRRNPVESIKELWANPAYLEHLTYAPEHRFADEGKSEHIYDEFMSGDWAWEMQTLLPDGTTLVPVILSSDKTQLCQFRGDKTTYPVYLTIGNISKSIRRKPSFRTQKLIGHLPTVSLDGNDLSTDNARLIRTQLFHYAMGVITSTLRTLSPTDGIELTSGDGVVRLGFPVVAAYVADYPEQALVTCTRYSQTCPKCFVSKDELGEHVTGDP